MKKLLREYVEWYRPLLEQEILKRLAKALPKARKILINYGVGQNVYLYASLPEGDCTWTIDVPNDCRVTNVSNEKYALALNRILK